MPSRRAPLTGGTRATRGAAGDEVPPAEVREVPMTQRTDGAGAGVPWHDDAEEAIAEAGRTGRLALLDFFSPT